MIVDSLPEEWLPRLLARLEAADAAAAKARAAGVPRRAPLAAGYVDEKSRRQHAFRQRQIRRREKAKQRARRGLWMLEVIVHRVAKRWVESRNLFAGDES